MNIRFGTGLDYSVKSLDVINIDIHEKTLTQPLRWIRPRMIFVSSMSDLFHESVLFEMIDKVFAIMALCPQHTFQVLTKRPARMLEYFRLERVRTATALITKTVQSEWDWPLANVWIGVTCENQQTYDERSKILRQILAAVKWFSFEPLLGEIIADWLGDWIVVGGESGRRDQDIRPMHPQWARSLRDQCVAAGVPFFFKQWGEWEPMFAIHDYYDEDQECEFKKGEFIGYERNGKKAAGRLLDGREWNEYPSVRTKLRLAV
jgi:protein gp37